MLVYPAYQFYRVCLCILLSFAYKISFIDYAIKGNINRLIINVPFRRNLIIDSFDQSEAIKRATLAFLYMNLIYGYLNEFLCFSFMFLMINKMLLMRK